LYHKKLYADESLKISQENFEKPDNLTIEIDCNDDEEEFLEMNLDQQIDF
jgi:penicillin-binding protein 1A